jgi:hypothetical protein
MHIASRSSDDRFSDAGDEGESQKDGLEARMTMVGVQRGWSALRGCFKLQVGDTNPFTDKNGYVDLGF